MSDVEPSPDAASAQPPSNEYRRALRDYTQLTRHRLANPLTAISAGITALRELDEELDDAQRDALLESVQTTAARLEQAILHPELALTIDGSAAELDVLPELSERELADLMVADAVEAEQRARTINERLLAQVTMHPEHPVGFLCECWAVECTEQVTMTLADYFLVHARHDQFVIAPHHDLPSVEQVTERADGWWVVRKTATAMRTAANERGAPRA